MPQKTIEGKILEASLNVFWVVKDDVFHPFVFQVTSGHHVNSLSTELPCQ